MKKNNKKLNNLSNKINRHNDLKNNMINDKIIVIQYLKFLLVTFIKNNILCNILNFYEI